MIKSLCITLIILNVVGPVVAMGTAVFLKTMPDLEERLSHEELSARINTVTDLPKLRSVIARDDEQIRSLQIVVHLLRRWTGSIVLLFATFAAANLTLAISYSRQANAAATRTPGSSPYP